MSKSDIYQYSYQYITNPSTPTTPHYQILFYLLKDSLPLGREKNFAKLPFWGIGFFPKHLDDDTYFAAIAACGVDCFRKDTVQNLFSTIILYHRPYCPSLTYFMNQFMIPFLCKLQICHNIIYTGYLQYPV